MVKKSLHFYLIFVSDRLLSELTKLSTPELSKIFLPTYISKYGFRYAALSEIKPDSYSV